MQPRSMGSTLVTAVFFHNTNTTAQVGTLTSFGVTDATACFVINVVSVAAKGTRVPLQDTWCGLGEVVHRALPGDPM